MNPFQLELLVYRPVSARFSQPCERLFCSAALQSCLVGIVVPDPDFLPMWLKKKGIEGSYSELCKNKVRVVK